MNNFHDRSSKEHNIVIVYNNSASNFKEDHY